MDVRLRPTAAQDLAFVMELERRPENEPFISAWERAEHEAAIARPDREHWIVERGNDACGFLIAYDLVAADCGVYVKRFAAWPHDGGAGRAALQRYLDHAFGDLGADYVWLSVRPGNARAQHVYERLGFLDFVAPEAEMARHRAAIGRAGPPRNRLMIRRRP